ncbi:helix-turn-helix domain-containing protein [Chryseolinea lacunae]|uniref:Helix-turn-helix domain-containing protein n=1 Tax=Chryseolinea lacunae TaxID=2801331 RepID=A0ABS1KLB8_9BACT|nr:helix-turn-helix domain-containing protein [Chryseolinea lacunae]MBL0740037.1 helix-turn-helix domain-containing protein [Chryseolinea lacunae]
MHLFREFSQRKIGLARFDSVPTLQGFQVDLKAYNKVLYLRAGSSVQIDFNGYHVQQDALFFIGATQYFQFPDKGYCQGALVYFNTDFYCIQRHDDEVSCNGILYNNVYEATVIFLNESNGEGIKRIFFEMAEEVQRDDTSVEEMLRILLKEMIIKATRMWKQNVFTHVDTPDAEFLRRFSQLIETHYKQQHQVADYAALLNITPKALNQRVSRFRNTSPHDLIKERILLEAKRMLIYTDHSIKEIAFDLGYEDPAYFNRMFSKETGLVPTEFRKDYKDALLRV